MSKKKIWWVLMRSNGRLYAMPISFRSARTLRDYGARVFYATWTAALRRETVAA